MRNTEVSSLPPVHVVAGIIRHPDNSSKIFFTQRQKGQHLQNLWEFPGGKVEVGESRFQALKRELKEETDIHVHAALPFHSLIHHYKDKTVYLDVWEVQQYSGRAHGREGQQSAWLMLHELSKYPFPEADLPVLNALSLPSELLITPDLSESQLDWFLPGFYSLLQKYRYPLILFRSHLLDDAGYSNVAKKLAEICKLNESELIITRPDLKSLQLTLFESFQRKHLSSSIIRNLTSNPFDESITVSASCQNSEELNLAEKMNCNFALLSAVREESDFPGRNVHGWFTFKKLTSQTSIPVFALGGVRRKDLSVARYQGAVGVAGTDSFRIVKPGKLISL